MNSSHYQPCLSICQAQLQMNGSAKIFLPQHSDLDLNLRLAWVLIQSVGLFKIRQLFLGSLIVLYLLLLSTSHKIFKKYQLNCLETEVFFSFNQEIIIDFNFQVISLQYQKIMPIHTLKSDGSQNFLKRPQKFHQIYQQA